MIHGSPCFCPPGPPLVTGCTNAFAAGKKPIFYELVVPATMGAGTCANCANYPGTYKLVGAEAFDHGYTNGTLGTCSIAACRFDTWIPSSGTTLVPFNHLSCGGTPAVCSVRFHLFFNAMLVSGSTVYSVMLTMGFATALQIRWYLEQSVPFDDSPITLPRWTGGGDSDGLCSNIPSTLTVEPTTGFV
jgi:hypothetical protein